MMKVCIDDLPPVRGRYVAGAEMSALTWLRVGGPADVVFIPHDEHDLADFLKNTPESLEIFPVGTGSNLLVRDGGIRGVVIRPGAGFRKVSAEGTQIRAGAGVSGISLSRKAAEAGIAGLEFYCGIPGTVGGALAMNAGAYGCETADVLIEAGACDRSGVHHLIRAGDMGFSYRHCARAHGLVFTGAVFRGYADDRGRILERMEIIRKRREETQPVRERTGGSTFSNPCRDVSGGLKSWQLIERTGGRGRVRGGAQMSERHCNFMINRGNARARDLEELGESVRADVARKTGIMLDWEIRRIGEEGS